MLKTRIIPTLLIKNFGLVKGVGFDSWRHIGAILPAVKVYNRRQVDELIVLNISARSAGQGPDFDEVHNFASECFIPLTVGGGISKIEDVQALLRAGADKVSINTACYETPDLIDAIAHKFGNQCIVASIDAYKNTNGTYVCVSNSGTKEQDVSPVDWAREMESRGAGEILITSIKNDGTMQGYDVDLIRSVSESVSIPVIASGGAGNYEDMYQAIEQGKAQAISAASMFHFTEQTPLEAKRYLSKKGIPVTRFYRQ